MGSRVEPGVQRDRSLDARVVARIAQRSSASAAASASSSGLCLVPLRGDQKLVWDAAGRRRPSARGPRRARSRALSSSSRSQRAQSPAGAAGAPQRPRAAPRGARRAANGCAGGSRLLPGPRSGEERIRESAAAAQPRSGGARRMRRRELVVGELGERAHMPRRVDDDLLVLECRVEVRDDPHLPARRSRARVRAARARRSPEACGLRGPRRRGIARARPDEGGSIAPRFAPGRRARAGAMTTVRPESGSRRSSGGVSSSARSRARLRSAAGRARSAAAG